MKKLIYIFVVLGLIFISNNVYAENTVRYNLTITNDFKFKETINYVITDYEQIQNGYNYFNSIIEDDVYVDILYKVKYKKTSNFRNGKYYVTLSTTYSEYSLSNSRFLNDCFENSNYGYDMDGYSFRGSGGFNCLYADSLIITIVTNQPVSSTNATVNGNKYVWKPKNNNFTMRMKIDKDYSEADTEMNPNNITDDIDYDELEKSEERDSNAVDDNSSNDDTNTPEEESSNADASEEDNDSSTSIIVIIILVAVLIIACIVAFVILRKKKEGLNKI